VVPSDRLNRQALEELARGRMPDPAADDGGGEAGSGPA
jgi:hypothetical protein